MRISREISVVAIAALCTFAPSCAKKKVASAPPPPVPASAPSNPEPVSRPAATRPAAPVAKQEPARPRYPDAETRRRIDELLTRIQDAYFDYDRHNLRPDAVETLKSDARELGDIIRQYPDFKLRVEGYCDERGSAEYNMALGDRRAVSAREYLSNMGVPVAQMTVVSFGKEQQVCSDHAEPCWQKNRRVHIAAVSP